MNLETASINSRWSFFAIGVFLGDRKTNAVSPEVKLLQTCLHSPSLIAGRDGLHETMEYSGAREGWTHLLPAFLRDLVSNISYFFMI